MYFPYFILGLRLVQSVSKANEHKYFSINVHNRKLFLHKATATWYLQDKQTHISCNRIQRVQLKKIRLDFFTIDRFIVQVYIIDVIYFYVEKAN